MVLIDTHCHIHEANYSLDIGDVLTRAHHMGIDQLICVGTSEDSSRKAVTFAGQHEHVYASVGVHPHDTKDGWKGIEDILISRHSPITASPSLPQQSPFLPPANKHLQPESFLLRTQERPGAKPFVSGRERRGEENEDMSKIIAIGEIGLDYFYTHSPRDIQIKALEEQIELALKHNLPIIFHVRDAFDDFWPVLDNFHGIRGELHSFIDSVASLEEGLKRGLFIGVNGISTFTKDARQQKMFQTIPLNRMLLETDAPFLTPAPLRGRINEPAFVRHVAEFHAQARGISLEEIAAATTANARALFALS